MRGQESRPCCSIPKIAKVVFCTQDFDFYTDSPIHSLEGHIKADMALFMVAGTDTSSVTLTFCLLLLLNNADKLAKLVEELDGAFPGRNDPITFEKTLNVPYLNAVLNESMRVMPVAVGMLDVHSVFNALGVSPDTEEKSATYDSVLTFDV